MFADQRISAHAPSTLWAMLFVLAAAPPALADPSLAENPLNRHVPPPVKLAAGRVASPPELSADPCDWTMAPALTMHRRDVSPLRSQPLDQRVTLWAGWEPNALYLAAVADDADHVNDQTGPRTWDGDSLQLGLVAGRRWQELVLALTADGPSAWRFGLEPLAEHEFRVTASEAATDIRYRAARRDGTTVYTAAIPAGVLGVGRLAAGDTLRLNVAVHERASTFPRIGDALTLAPGMLGPKYIAPYARLTLLADAKQVRTVTRSYRPRPPEPAPSAEPNRRELAIVTDRPRGAVAVAMSAIYPDRCRVFDPADGLDPNVIGRYDKLLVVCDAPGAVPESALLALTSAVERGATAAVDLGIYARACGARRIEASLPAEPDLAGATGRAAAIAREHHPVPLAVVAGEAPLSAGFPAGSEVPWFARRGHRHVQMQLDPNGLSRGSAVVARSSLPPHGPVWLSRRIGRGVVHAIDLAGTDEPTLNWDDRGSFNKYAIVQNALGHGLRFGTYVNRRPTYAQYVQSMRRLADRHPALTLTVEGFRNGYNRFGWCIGNPDGPIYVYTGNMHEVSEYRAGLYALRDFASYLARHADTEPYRSRLARIGVKIIPVVLPEMLAHARNDFAGEGEEMPLPPTRWAGEVDNVVLAIQQHHGVGPLKVGFGYSLGKGGAWARRIGARAMGELYATPPGVFWSARSPNPRPVPLSQSEYVGPNPPSWDGYFVQWPMYGGLVTLPAERVRQARLAVLAEHSVYGLSPASGYYDVPIREYRSALLSDQSCAFLLASVLEPPPAQAKGP